MTNRKTVGQQIVAALGEAVAFERGELSAPVHRVRVTARRATIAPAPSYTRERIANLREQLRLSQPVFAMALNVSADTVKAWEQGKRAPDGAAARLLQMAEEHPQWILDSLREDQPSDAE